VFLDLHSGSHPGNLTAGRPVVTFDPGDPRDRPRHTGGEGPRTPPSVGTGRPSDPSGFPR